jgi:putative transposase
MPNHVHLILVPADPTGLARALGDAHRRYTAYINARARQSGHLFQGRFGSVAMDEEHLLCAARYVCSIRFGPAWSPVPGTGPGRAFARI